MRFSDIKRKVKLVIFTAITQFYRPFLLSFFRKKIMDVAPGKQMFFLARLDFGTYLLLLHYISLWQKKRGEVVLVVLTSRFNEVNKLAKIICPEASIVTSKSIFSSLLVKFIGQTIFHYEIFARIHAQLLAEWPNTLYIYDQPVQRSTTKSKSSYVKFLDPIYYEYREHVKPDFLDGYLKVRPLLDYHSNVYNDMINLHNEGFVRSFSSECLSIDKPYIVMNLNCKDYKNPIRNNRSIKYPERYEVLIDYLIQKGFSVVIQGRKEQPSFKERKGLFNYSRSPLATSENDLKLYSNAVAAISSKTGPEVFTTICDIPVLGLNYTELCSMQPNVRMRFYPKHLKAETGEYLSWLQFIQSKAFFQIGDSPFSEGLEFEDLSEDEMLAALDEFLELLSKPHKDWLSLTPEQEEFKKQLNPMHLDLYNIKSVPIHHYLAHSKSSITQNICK